VRIGAALRSDAPIGVSRDVVSCFIEGVEMRLSSTKKTGELRTSRRRDLSVVDGGRHQHAVQFYESDEFLIRSVSDFLLSGFKLNEPAVVIATAEHREGLAQELASRDVDVAGYRQRGMLIELDARNTLSAFMVNGAPDSSLFRTTIAPVLEKARGRRSPPVRAYGEMVNLLWCDGNGNAALALETLWNQLSETQEFSLLCGYGLERFDDAADAAIFAAICGAHTHVVPTERYVERDEASRLREISILQQRAQALESEARRRGVLEATLRTALAERERLLEAERTARAEAEQARRVAEQANRAKSEFLAIMSHELRTPLNAIAGYAELMEIGVQGPVSEGQREALERIQRSQRHLLGLINQVLNYARLETGNVRYTFADVALDGMLRAAEALVFPQMQAKGLHYTYVGCDPSLAVRADSEKLQQIMLNLLTNATKFTDRGGDVRVECEVVGGFARLHVHDTGVGIPADKLSLIFDPFVQVDSQYTRTRDGVGLGLAISRDLARGMGGELSVESEFGHGSTFTLVLPVAGAH
jgi:signal transduction histidine kinase